MRIERLFFVFSVCFFVLSSAASRNTSVDHHPSRHLAALHIHRELGNLLFLTKHLSPSDMRLQALVEVEGAHGGVENSGDNQSERDDRKEGERPSSREVLPILGWLVHPHQLEHEVGQGTVIENLDDR